MTWIHNFAGEKVYRTAQNERKKYQASKSQLKKEKTTKVKETGSNTRYQKQDQLIDTCEVVMIKLY